MSKKETSGQEVFRPYARLITILGDQLITNKIVAINEIVKNSYDADAEEVTVRFINFENQNSKSVPVDKRPYIEIEDDGIGMTIDIIKNVWLRPATPYKLNAKKGEDRFTKKGRLMQGEKGIGRFAVHKLGDDINIFTKTSGGQEAQLRLDFTSYDQSDQLKLFKDQEELDKHYKFLDEIKNTWSVNSTPKRIAKKKGTLIQIKNLRDKWTENDMQLLSRSFKNLTTPEIPEEDKKALGQKVNLVKDFDIDIEWEGKKYKSSSNLTFKTVCEEAPFKFIGELDNSGVLKYKYVGRLGKERIEGKSINLFENDYNLNLYSINKRFYYIDAKTKEKIKDHDPNVGRFKFILYGFDLFDKAKWKNKKNELEFIKDNSVYLFRDGIRVYPYGNKEIDWLEISKKRAEWKAGDFFSYNDLIGFVFISQEENEKLKDATNREGLMDIEGAYEDFKALLIASIQVMKYEADIDKGKDKNKKVKPLDLFKKELNHSYSSLINRLNKIGDKETREYAKKYLESTKGYLDEMNRRTDIYEDLAGLGLAVEKASHDTLSLLEKMNLNISDLKKRLVKNENIPKRELINLLSDFEDNTSLVYEQMQLIQPLFRISKRNETIVSVNATVVKLLRYFELETKNYKISVDLQVKKDIKIKTSVGLLLQVLINLMDNAVYWLHEKEKKERKIKILIDGSNNQLIFADSGVGIKPEIADLVFIEFFSTKPKDRGRGLGLFIAKEIIDRLDGTIEVISNEKLKILKGANFKIIFPDIKHL